MTDDDDLFPDDFDELPPLPRAGADRRHLIEPADWLRFEAALARALADAAMSVGRLDQMLAAMDRDARAGATRRLALIEIESMLWAQSTPLRREEIGRDLMEARADSDLDAMGLARWALRRLEGQGSLTDLRSFLALRRVDVAGLDDPVAPRPAGDDFDAAATSFHEVMSRLQPLHPLSRAPAARIGWRLAEVSPPEDLVEAACWNGRAMASGCEALAFVPLGRHGRAVWNDGAEQPERLARHLAAVTAGTEEARLTLRRIADWAEDARRRTATIKGDNPARIIAALAAHPLMSTAMVETAAGTSRATAERLLARMYGQGVVREVTGTKRFRLWTAAA